MNTDTMKSILFSITAAMAILVFSESVVAQSGQAGFTIGHSTHTSYWFKRAQSGNSQSFPINKTTKFTLSGFYEKTGLFRFGSVRSDIRIELSAGFGGETRENWLPLSETVSDDDIGYGLAVILKFGYPVELLSGQELVPFLGVGPALVGVSASGEASQDTEYASSYDYEEGFADGVYGLALDLGASVSIARFILTPEIRFLIAGDSFGDWGYVTSPDGADWTMFMVSVGFPL